MTIVHQQGQADPIITGAVIEGSGLRITTIDGGVHQGIFKLSGGQVVLTGIPQDILDAFFNLSADDNINKYNKLLLGNQGASGAQGPQGILGAQGWQGPPGGAGARSIVTAYASGSPYILTDAPALLGFGGTDPIITIPETGTWHITAMAKLRYNKAEFTTNSIITVKLRRTNNTASDLANASDTLMVVNTDYAGLGSLTEEVGFISIDVVYTTTRNDDIIELWGSVDTLPTSGSLDVVAARIVAT